MTYSAEYLLNELTKQKAQKVNMIFLKRGDRVTSHHTTPEMHGTLNKFIDFKEYVDYVQTSSYLTTDQDVGITTTYLGNDGIYRAFIGLDIENPNEQLVSQVIPNLAKELKTPVDLFKSNSSYHAYLPEQQYDNDIGYIKKLFEIIKITSMQVNDLWINIICDEIEHAETYIEMKNNVLKIFEQVGHFDDNEKYTFIDIRHIAHAIISNARSKNEAMHTSDGIRTQLFFRISAKKDNGVVPYFLKRFTE